MGQHVVGGQVMKVSIRSAIRLMLIPMDVPLDRRDMSEDSNLRWLQRNLGINNDGPEVGAVLKYVSLVLSGQEWIEE